MKPSKLGNGKTPAKVIRNWRELLGPEETEQMIQDAHADIINGLHKTKWACRETT